MENTPQKVKRSFKQIIERYDILISYSVLIDKSFDLFVSNWKEDKNIGTKRYLLITFGDWSLLKLQGRKEETLAKRVAGLNDLLKQGSLRLVIGGENFKGAFQQLREYSEICVLVKNEDADKIFANAREARFSAIYLRRLNHYGYMSSIKSSNKSKYYYRENRSIVLPDQQSGLFNTKIMVQRVPKTGDKVYASAYGELTLGEVLDDFHDGKNYNVTDQLAAKIYKSRYLDTIHNQKIEKMLTMRMSTYAICWPIDILTNKAGDFVGYLFNAYQGESIQYAVMRQTGLKKIFPKWEKIDLVRLAIVLMEQIEYLHWNNILIGCLDLDSIKVLDSDTVYLLNPDYFQIDVFPCMQRNTVFMPPERLDYMDQLFWFTEKTDNYVLAVLLFMLMLPGKEPYTQRWGKRAKNIKEGKFPYPLGEVRSKGVPIGVWRFVWSHLDKRLKEAFFQTFQRGEDRSLPEHRFGTMEWMDRFKDYYRKLENGNIEKVDSNSLQIFPRTFKRSSYDNLRKCEICGLEFPDWYMDREYSTVCRGCITKMSDEGFQCVDCGRKFLYSIREMKYHEKLSDWKPQKRCKECKERKRRR